MLAGLALAYALSAPAEAAVLKPTWSASTTAPAENGVGYEATMLGDGKAATAWFEGVDGSGLGESVTADLGGEKTVTSFQIWGGYNYSKTYWGHYNRPKTVVVEFSDGTTQEFGLQDQYGGQVVTLSAPKKTSSMRFKLKAVYSSDAYNDTAISEIQISDTTKDLHAPVRASTASTTFPSDADGNYDAKNTNDGIADSMWCEGNKTGDGTGEWLEYAFPSAQSVSKLVLRNGNGSSFGQYMKGNRTTQVTLAFSDGSKETLAVKDLISEQTIPFAERTTDKVRVSFDVIKKGSQYNDLCISEVAFAP